jgi:hypothetical protein
LEDGVEQGLFDAKKTSELCVPAEVEAVEVEDVAERQVSYKIKPSPGEPKHVKRRVVAEDALGTHRLDTKKVTAICLPATLVE